MFMNGHLMRNMGLHSYNKNGLEEGRNHKLSIYDALIN